MKALVLGALLAAAPGLALAQKPKKDVAPPAAKPATPTPGAKESTPTPPPAQGGEPQNAPTVKVTRGEGGRTVIKIEGIVVKGTVQKPEAFYILHRSTINYDWDTLKQEFVPKILDSVKHSPF